MRRVRVLLGIAGVLVLSLGSLSCTTGPGCLCLLSSAASKFAYVMLELDTIAAYTITGGTGALAPVAGSPFGGNVSPFYGAADPAGKFLYAVDQTRNSVYGFSIDQTTGALTAVPGSPYSLTPLGARVPIVDPSGSFLYVTHLDTCGDDCKGAISAFKIAADGSLTQIAGSPFTTDYGTVGIAITPSGQFLYTLNGKNCCRTPNSVSGFQVNAISGALTEITGSPFTGFSGESGVILTFGAILPSGKFLYVTGPSLSPPSLSFVIALSIDPTSGALALLPGGAAFVQSGLNSQGIEIDGIDDVLFVANNGSTNATMPVDGSISAYSINATSGALTNVPGSPLTTTGSNPLQLAVDRSCKFLYVTNNNPAKGIAAHYVLGFSINAAAGTLTALQGSPFATPTGGPPQGIVLTPHH